MSIKVVEYLVFQFPETILYIRLKEMWDCEISKFYGNSWSIMKDMIITWLDDTLSHIKERNSKFFILKCDSDLLKCEAVAAILFYFVIFPNILVKNLLFNLLKLQFT